MRKITALLLAGLMIFSLAACSNNSSNTDSEPTGSTGQSTISSENTVPGLPKLVGRYADGGIYLFRKL